MNNKYRQGSIFEREVKKWLEGNGYYVARSAGSKSLNDLVAIPYQISTSINILAGIQYIPINFSSAANYKLWVSVNCVNLIQCKVTKGINRLNLLFSDEMIDFKEQKFNCDVKKYLFLKTTDERKIYIYQNVDHGYTLIWEGNKLI